MSEFRNFWGNKKIWLLIVFSIMVLFPNLGGLALFDPDEPVYAETAKEMIQFQEYLSPRIYGEYWYDKPPMYYWLVAGAFHLLGISEFAARLPATISALLCVVLITYYAAKRMNYRAGFFSGLILVTSFEFFYLAKGAVTDSTLNLFLTGCLLALLEKRYLIGGVLAGLATLTKGPIGLIFPAAILGIYLLVTRQMNVLKRKDLWLGLLVYFAVAVPWYAAMYGVHGTVFIETFLGFHNLTRFTSPEHPETSGWYFFIPVLLIGFFPWSVFMLRAVWNVIKQQVKGKNADEQLIFFIIWAAFIFLFFSASKTKLISYIFPMFPPLALLTGWYLDRLCYLGKNHNIKWLHICHMIFILVLAGSLFYVSQVNPEIGKGSFLESMVLVAMAIGCFWIYGRYSVTGIVAIQVVGMLLFANILVYSMVPQVEGRLGCKDFGKSMLVEYNQNDPIYIAKFLRPGIAYYTDIYGKELANDVSWKKALEKDESAYYVITQAMYKQLSESERNVLQTIVAEDDKLLLKKRGTN